MSFNSLIQNGVAIANSLTKSMQGVVLHQSWLGTTGFGEATYSGAVSRRALIDQSEKPRYTQSGELILTKASLTFLDPIPALAVPGRVNPVDSRDIFTLPDGTSGPVVATSGFYNPETSAPYVIEVTLGK